MQLDVKIKEELRKLCDGLKVENRLAIRAKIILLKAEGFSISKIAELTQVSTTIVKKWCGRFKKNPTISALNDSYRSGKPFRIKPETKLIIYMVACSTPDDLKTVNSTEELKQLSNNALEKEKKSVRGDAVIWTLESISNKVFELTGERISRSYICDLLNEADIKPHKKKMWLHSPDPEFREKSKVICDIYLNNNASTVLCVDEKTGMQAIERKHKTKGVVPGGSVRMEVEYVRHGTQTLIGAYDIRTGKISGMCQKTRTANDLVEFMENIAKNTDGNVTVIWDNLNTHKGKRWDEFNERHGKRFTFVYTPVHASWLNQIEIWFGILHRKVLRNGSFLSESDLNNSVMNFIEQWNSCAKIFKWKFNGIFN